MHPITPATLAEELSDTYLRYFDTAFWTNDEETTAERRPLLKRDDTLVGQIMIGPAIPYTNTDPLFDVPRRSGISESSVRDVGQAVFPGVRDCDRICLKYRGINEATLTFL